MYSAMALFMAAGFIAFQTVRSTNVPNLLVSANLEALSQGEGSGPCEGYGSVLCSYNNFWVYKQH